MNSRDKQKRTREIQAFISSLTPFPILDEQTGISTEYLLGKCFRCKEKSLLVLDMNNFYCFTCKINKAKSYSMKKIIADINKLRDKIDRFPDEQWKCTWKCTLSIQV